MVKYWKFPHAITTSIPHYTLGSSQYNKERKINKNYKSCKGGNKIKWTEYEEINEI